MDCDRRKMANRWLGKKWYPLEWYIPTSMLITELIASLFSEHDYVFGLCERKNVVHNKEKLKKIKRNREIARL